MSHHCMSRARPLPLACDRVLYAKIPDALVACRNIGAFGEIRFRNNNTKQKQHNTKRKRLS